MQPHDATTALSKTHVLSTDASPSRVKTHFASDDTRALQSSTDVLPENTRFAICKNSTEIPIFINDLLACVCVFLILLKQSRLCASLRLVVGHSLNKFSRKCVQSKR